MLFLGFSLRDENFHRIADAVRRALVDRDAYGTVLTLEREPMLEELWTRDLAFVALATPRRLELFLDCLLAHAQSATQHLLDDRFTAVLSPAEKRLKEALAALGELPPEVRATSAWAEVEALLVRLGRRPGGRT
jgi:hypothetical protein